MKFCIADVEYLESVGADTSNWRKSVDGTKALCHTEFVELMVDLNKVDTYEFDDPDFIERMQSEEWTEKITEGEEA